MRYAILDGKIIKNIVVSDADFAAAQGWIECPEGANIGDTFFDGVLAPAAPLVDLDILSTDTWSIDADATDYATITYMSDDKVYFIVDGSVHAVDPVDSVATIEITADAPGAITVQVRSQQMVITAVEVIE